ncbi:MAG: N-acetyl sugar amidotransferase [Pseudomonadota bacterium]
MMQYCTSCVLSNMRPNLFIGEDGVCDACHSWGKKQNGIDWQAREKDFVQLAAHIKKTAQSAWDCVIPVSGGKDSTWQVATALEYGLKPLCVTWRSPARNALGQRNLDNLIALGVDHMDFSVNPEIEKILSIKTLRAKGSVAIPMHMALFALPMRVALNFHIPLVLWGESSGIEYGGAVGDGKYMDNEWLQKFGVTQGTTAHDWVDDDLTPSDLYPYLWPSPEEMKAGSVTATFLGWFFPWDPVATATKSRALGLQSSEEALIGYYNFSDIDDDFIIPVHHWLKWYKFGFTRTWDNLSLEIRAGRMQRDEAITLLRDLKSEEPKQAIDQYCAWSGLSHEEFHSIIATFRNTDIWACYEGVWKIENFLLKDWDWRQ